MPKISSGSPRWLSAQAAVLGARSQARRPDTWNGPVLAGAIPLTGQGRGATPSARPHQLTRPPPISAAAGWPLRHPLPMDDRRHLSMLREYTLADTLTIANAACGTLAIFLCLQFLAEGQGALLWTALALLPAAFMFDAADGWVARKTGRQSRLGADMDSLSDIISFGVAPAVIGYTVGLRGGWDVAVLIYFVVCGISRLARFNVTAAAMSDDRGKVTHFQGTPIPTSLSLVIVLAIAFARGHIGHDLWGGSFRLGPALLHPLVGLFALSGSAMISATLRIPKP